MQQRHTTQYIRPATNGRKGEIGNYRVYIKGREKTSHETMERESIHHQKRRRLSSGEELELPSLGRKKERLKASGVS